MQVHPRARWKFFSKPEQCGFETLTSKKKKKMRISLQLLAKMTSTQTPTEENVVPQPIRSCPKMDTGRAWLNLALFSASQLVVGGFTDSLGALITPISLEYGVDASTASVGINMFFGVHSLTVLLVNVVMERGWVGAK